MSVDLQGLRETQQLYAHHCWQLQTRHPSYANTNIATVLIYGYMALNSPHQLIYKCWF